MGKRLNEIKDADAQKQLIKAQIISQQTSPIKAAGIEQKVSFSTDLLESDDLEQTNKITVIPFKNNKKKKKNLWRSHSQYTLTKNKKVEIPSTSRSITSFS